jgi:virginiamycin A acetyltransferase
MYSQLQLVCKSVHFVRRKIFTFLITRSKNVMIGKDVVIENSRFHGTTEIGDHTEIWGLAVGGGKRTSIGKYCAIAEGVRILTTDHNLSYANFSNVMQIKNRFKYLDQSKGEVVIKNAVWIGSSVTILSGVTIGDGAVIGAGSVVTKNVKPFSIYCGVPARFLRKRFSDDIIDFLLEIKWWDWDEGKVKRNKVFFETDLTKITASQLSKIIVSEPYS